MHRKFQENFLKKKMGLKCQMSSVRIKIFFELAIVCGFISINTAFSEKNVSNPLPRPFPCQLGFVNSSKRLLFQQKIGGKKKRKNPPNKEMQRRMLI